MTSRTAVAVATPRKIGFWTDRAWVDVYCNTAVQPVTVETSLVGSVPGRRRGCSGRWIDFIRPIIIVGHRPCSDWRQPAKEKAGDKPPSYLVWSSLFCAEETSTSLRMMITVK